MTLERLKEMREMLRNTPDAVDMVELIENEIRKRTAPGIGRKRTSAHSRKEQNRINQRIYRAKKKMQGGVD